MRVLVVGSGGREHALAWRLARDGAEVTVAPGNGGTSPNAPWDGRVETLGELVRSARADLVVVGPETPIAAGAGSASLGAPVFAPSAEAARLESSKAFARAFAQRHGVPVPAWREFASYAETESYVRSLGEPPVVKADGLAAGKGVVVARSAEEALAAAKGMFDGRFGAAGSRVVVEERLVGEEFSLFVLAGRSRWHLLGTARDYKRLADGDAGPNTGGMGSVSPATVGDEAVASALKRVVEPTFDGLAEEGLDYTGFLYFGLMWARETPCLLEYNVRMGDPEAQALLPTLDGNLARGLCEAMEGGAPHLATRNFGTCVVVASEGYPEAPVTGRPLALSVSPPALVFHAGTVRANGGVVATGGRVVGVVGLAETRERSRALAYEALRGVALKGAHWRRDIGA